MTKEEIISMLSKELNSEWTNGVTCLMVENSDSYIPVIVHHNKNELIVEVGEQDKKIYRMNSNLIWGDSNAEKIEHIFRKYCYHQTVKEYKSNGSLIRSKTDYYQAIGG